MAYIHAAIPLNISAYQNHFSLFATTLNEITNTPSNTNTPVIKSIKDMALFAAKRLNKLANKLRTIDNILPNDDFSQSLNSRQKRFIDLLFVPNFTTETRKIHNDSLEGNLFDKNCNLKNLTVPPPYFFNPARPNFRQGRILGIIHDMIRQDYKKQEIARRNYLWAVTSTKQKQQHNLPHPFPNKHKQNSQQRTLQTTLTFTPSLTTPLTHAQNGTYPTH